jgi:hypothetical protein
VVPFLVVSILDFREIPTKEMSASPIPACASTHSLQELAVGKDLLHPDSALPENQRGYAYCKIRKTKGNSCVFAGKIESQGPEAEVRANLQEKLTMNLLKISK